MYSKEPYEPCWKYGKQNLVKVWNKGANLPRPFPVGPAYGEQILSISAFTAI